MSSPISGFIISPARTVMLRACGSLSSQAMWCPKASADLLDYSLDMSGLFAGTGDSISAINSMVVTSAAGTEYDLTIMWSTFSQTIITIFLASGEPSTTQTLLFEVATTQGRVYSVQATIQINALTPATVPPSDFPAGNPVNGKVVMVGTGSLPDGYSDNGGVVMATEDDAPVGTPNFESVTASSYAGDGSGLNITVSTETQTIAEWIAALQKAAGQAGVGIAKIEASQGPVTAGQPSTVTLTATLTDGTTSETTFTAPAGADGVGEQGKSIEAISITQGAVTAGESSKADLNVTLSDGTELSPVPFTIPAGATGTGTPGASLASITATQSTVTAGEASTVTLTGKMSDGSTISAGSYEAPPGADGVGAPGLSLKSIAATQSTVTAGAPSTVTLTGTMSDGSTIEAGSYETPPGEAGSDADVTSANIATALGYTPADPLKFLALSPTALASLQTITAPSDTGNTNGYSVQIANNGGNVLQLGVINEYGVRFFGLKSTDGETGLFLTDDNGNAAYMAQHTSTDYSTEIYAGNFAVDTGYGSGGFRIIDKDSSNFQWQIWAENTATAPSPLYISAGTTAGTAWQDPAVSFSPTTNTATFLNEPVVSTVYTFATLPTSPADWQRAIVTDKVIGSGATGVMAMWNPNTKAWTGLSGEALT